MGLDTVEIVMAVEAVFNIRIEASDAMAMRTPRDLVDCVWHKVMHADTAVCPLGILKSSAIPIRSLIQFES